MSSEPFLETLRRLGYPDVDKLDAQSLDWMFENEALLPFFEWFSDNVCEDNVLTPAEIREYQTLQQSGEGILDGRQLEEALHNMSITDEEDLSEDKLREDVAELSQEVREASKRKERLIQQRNKLNLHHTSLSHKTSHMDEIDKRAKQSYKDALEQCHADNTQMNVCLESLSQAVRDLSALYTKLQDIGADSTTDMKNVEPPFLSQMSMQEYNAMEDKYSQEVKSFTKKQFFQGISEISGQRDGTRYEFLEVSHPESLLVRGETEDVNVADCQELARLQQVYPTSESKKISAIVDKANTIAKCESVREQLNTLQQDRSLPDVNKLSREYQTAQSQVLPLRREVAHLSENELPSLIQQNVNSRLTPILRGDYNLKISRQDYFISNQDKLIEQLVNQRARNEFLTMAYETESRNHRECHRLLLAISAQLQKNIKILEERMKLLADPVFSPTRHKRETIDMRDKFITNLHHIIAKEANPEKQQIFITYASILDGASHLGQHLETLENSLLSTNNGQDMRLRNLEKNLESCESLVYAGSSTTSGQPVLTPRVLQDNLTQLDTLTKKLEHTIMNVLKEVDSKKRSLKSDPLLATERELFKYFFNDPSQLRAVMEEVTSRVQAQKIK